MESSWHWIVISLVLTVVIGLSFLNGAYLSRLKKMLLRCLYRYMRQLRRVRQSVTGRLETLIGSVENTGIPPLEMSRRFNQNQ